MRLFALSTACTSVKTIQSQSLLQQDAFAYDCIEHLRTVADLNTPNSIPTLMNYQLQSS